MRDNTNIRESLINIDWFSRIGDTEDIFEGIDYKWIPSVDQIEKYLTSIKWENTCETPFFASLLQIYESGHIPVGYTGKIGSGKIIVY